MADKELITSEQALEKLKEGNRRFFAMRSKVTPDKLLDQRANSVTDQNPCAIILSCSDSRVPPELIFDQGIGDLFVIRVAGNIVSSAQIGSIEYAVSVLKTPLIVVLGHTGCGAVSVTLDAIRTGNGPLSPYLQYLMNKIKPIIEHEAKSVKELNPHYLQDLKVDEAVNLNIKHSVEQLSHRSLIIREAIKKNQLEAIGAYYDLESGLVGWDEEH